MLLSPYCVLFFLIIIVLTTQCYWIISNCLIKTPVSLFTINLLNRFYSEKDMETTEFDAALGGSVKLPYSINSLKFTAARSVEIAAMTESILRPSRTKLVFQCLPVHMRRRVMSHNAKRLPRKLRQAHLEQLKKSGLPPKQKRPSRKYRRRPANLLEEYNRRKKRNIWLETHIWHAKRFHMSERWGHRLPLAPCDKAFRACYRASSAHCLMQDISYYLPIRITGSVNDIKELFKAVTSPACGLSVGAKAYTTGNREGHIHLYEPNSFPLNYIGKANFLWDSINQAIWLFIHPSFAKKVESVLTDLLNLKENTENTDIPEKRRKIDSSQLKNIKMQVLPAAFNRFRLTGPNSHAVLENSLKCISDMAKIKSNEWVQQCIKSSTELHLKEKYDYWKSISSVSSPSQLPPKMIVGLIVRDPRLSRPSLRTKAKPEHDGTITNREILSHIPPNTSSTPLWTTELHSTIKSKVLTNGQFIQHVTELNLVPGEIFEEDPKLQSVPVVLIQRPGSQDSSYKKLGYGSGWDIIVPGGYALPFWLTFIMFGARSGGLRETESMAFEMGECYLPPDSEAGSQNEARIAAELKERYFKLPPSKRVNYIKLGISSPFICPWRLLLSDWSDGNVNACYVLRDWRLLEEIQECLKKKKQLPQIEGQNSCLVAVYLHLPVGSLRRHALICLPEQNDIANIKDLTEPQHEDPNEKIRKIKKKEHIAALKKLRRSKIKLKKKDKITTDVKKRKNKQELSEYVLQMRELWLPSQISTVRNICCRETMGYVSQGAFSFTEAHSCGVGYITYNALTLLSTRGLNQVLIRNTSSLKYRLANLEIIKNV